MESLRKLLGRGERCSPGYAHVYGPAVLKRLRQALADEEVAHAAELAAKDKRIAELEAELAKRCGLQSLQGTFGSRWRHGLHASGRRIVKQSSKAFWAAIHKSAALVRGLPAWTQAGIVYSDNFEGGVTVKTVTCRHCNGTGKEYRWEDGRGNSK